MENQYVKLVVFVPETHASLVREALVREGAGKMGNYDSCSFSTKGIGRFRPRVGAHPFIGTAVSEDGVGVVEEVIEERIETICERSKLKQVIEAVKRIHPYEEPALDIIPLL